MPERRSVGRLEACTLPSDNASSHGRLVGAGPGKRAASGRTFLHQDFCAQT
eukprot:CAMPEP_0181236472 /NCGR_PEP_ID=MMETSP1096-20121128/38198_1 /TAXON_ID=156174 ORGANISM="Chrysochromulina ericina, Strain CCMP281" /NCGR_SAMPLE_ID=MMETSP1096 /ASSEMBLY_ACC=CAM_ASM_000453 /LENGTH=50 /DNA_ID=CAMNT_0023331663 /DNA_START=64 /DNA_END=213 /DNA_ORIENTATION=+